MREKHQKLLEQGVLGHNEVEQHDKQIACLCIDGGGIRGIIQLIFLAELENKTNKKCS